MKKIADLLVDKEIVKIDFREKFVWTSGIESPIYCDCREIISDVEFRNIVIDEFLEKISKNNFSPDIIAGTATAGIPWASWVAEKLKLPMLYVRSKPKGHGGGKMVEGGNPRQKKILVVEDAISTGGSSIKSAKDLRKELDAKVENILAIFSWDLEISQKNSVDNKIKFWTLTNFGEIAGSLLEKNKISQDDFSKLLEFHKSLQA